jgi:L-rhamnose 1-dehydrogenase
MLKNKTIVVTGGASGIGRGIALAAAKHGAKAVVIGDISPEPKEGGATTVDLVRTAGADSRFVRTDVRDRAHVDTLIAAANVFGGADCVVCNAGIAHPGDGPDIASDAFDALIAINLKGVLNTAQAAATAMTTAGTGGSIVLISSIGGLRGVAVNLGYGATKGGVNMLATALADAHGPAGIRVNAICPGLIDTTLAQSSPPEAARAIDAMVSRMPLRRLGRPEEIGDAVAWLASDHASFITGAVLPVDGGQAAIL